MSKQAQVTTITVGDLYTGVTDGRIISDIELQREIVFDDEHQMLVIDSILTGIPLPAFYLWRNDDGVLEVLDGKQRIEAIKKFRQNNLEYNGKNWKGIDPDTQQRFNGTELSAIICEGDETLKREIFRRINTLGVSLSDFEVLNGLYHGRYIEELTDFARLRYVTDVFGSKARGANQYHVLQWLLKLEGIKVTREAVSDYVKAHKEDAFIYDKNRILPYFRFIGGIFADMSLRELYFELAQKYLKKQTEWREHRDAINQAIREFKRSDDWKLIGDKKGEIEDRILAIVGNVPLDPRRLFTADQKEELLTKLRMEGRDKNGMYQCEHCLQWFDPAELRMDHIKPWSRGGRTELSNAQLLCTPCNISKGNNEHYFL